MYELQNVQNPNRRQVNFTSTGVLHTCGSIGEVQRQACEVHVGIVVATNGLQGLQAEGRSPSAHLTVQITGSLPLRQELFCPQPLKHLHQTDSWFDTCTSSRTNSLRPSSEAGILLPPTAQASAPDRFLV